MFNTTSETTIEPGRVTLRTGTKTTYRIYGYAVAYNAEDGTPMIALQPADRRCKPVLRIPAEVVTAIEIDY